MESLFLNITDLNVHYHQTQALKDVNLQLKSGLRTAIIGPNGAGKSTLMNSILGLLTIESGTIQIDGKNYKQQIGKIAYVPQRQNVNWTFPITVWEVVAQGVQTMSFVNRSLTSEKKERVEQALEAMQLTDLSQRSINALSGGQKQRVFLARAMAQDANYYFLDEPLAGVDQLSESLIMEQLIAFQQMGKSSLTVHHQLDTAVKYFDSVILLNKTILAVGHPSTVLTAENIQYAYTGVNPTQLKSEV